MSIGSLRAAITAAGGTPASYDRVALWRAFTTAKGGTPTQFSTVGALREAITASGGTPTQYAVIPLLRELVTALGGTPSSFDPDALMAQIAGVVPPGLSIAGLTPANPQFGKSYTGNAASITGSAASAELVSGALPDGMSLTIVGANVVLTGTPTG